MVVFENSRIKILARAGPIVARLPADKPVMVEVGVYRGQMAEHLLDRRTDLRWIGVDNWIGVEKQPKAYIDTGDAHAIMTQLEQDECYQVARYKLARFGDRATIIRDTSSNAAYRFKGAPLRGYERLEQAIEAMFYVVHRRAQRPAPRNQKHASSGSDIDLCFLDARHDEEGVFSDCLAWWPAIKPGGYLGGHDFSPRSTPPRFGVNLAVEKFSAKIDVPYELDDGTDWFIRKPMQLWDR